MSIDLGKSYMSWGPTESVTYTAKRRNSDHTITVANAKRRALTTRDKFYLSGVMSLNGTEIAWNLHNTQVLAANFDPVLGTFEPQEADTITDSQARVYVVLPGGWELLSQGTRWKLVCSKQR